MVRILSTSRRGTHDGDAAADLEAALLVLFVALERGVVGRERDDGAGGLHAEDLGEGLDGVQALPAHATARQSLVRAVRVCGREAWEACL